MNFDPRRMRTADDFYAAKSYFNPTDSIAAAILCQRLSLDAGLLLETSSSTGALPDPFLPAEVKPVVLPQDASDLQAYKCIDGHGWIMMNAYFCQDV